MVDAGSAGTRAHVFSWGSGETVAPYVSRHNGTVIKSHIPLSAAVSDKSAIERIFKPVIDAAVAVIPSGEWCKTRIYIYATAGLRMLGTGEQMDVIESLYRYLHDNSPFLVDRRNVRIMSGAEEAIYGWLAVNHLLGFKETAGAIDMGGASIQVAFETHRRDRLDHQHQIYVNGRRYTIYAVSLLKFGVNEAKRRLSKSMNVEKSANPCYPFQYQGDGFVGSGSFLECSREIEKRLVKNLESVVTRKTASIPVFYAMASFYYLNSFFGLPENSSQEQIEHATADFCRRSWQELKEKYGDNQFLSNYCFFGAYQHLFLSPAFGFDFGNSTVYKSATIDGADLSWAIGAMLVEAGIAKIDPFTVPSLLPILFSNVFAVLYVVSLLYKTKCWGRRAQSGALGKGEVKTNV